MAAKKQQVAPIRLLTPREKLEGDILGLEHLVDYYTASIKKDAEQLSGRMAEAGKEFNREIGHALDPEYLKSSTGNLTSSEVSAWAVNALMWVMPNLHIEKYQQEAARLDSARRDLKAKRA